MNSQNPEKTSRMKQKLILWSGCTKVFQKLIPKTLISV